MRAIHEHRWISACQWGYICFVVILVAIGTCASAATELRHSEWKANEDSGTYAAWNLGDYGGRFDTGSASSVIDSSHAHSGRYSLEMTSDTTHGVAASRNFRWAIDAAGTPLPRSAIYTAWFYWDRVYSPTLFWNIMQWKTRTNDAGGNSADWAINLANDGHGMYLEWYDIHTRSNHSARTANGSIKPGVWYEIKVRYTFSLQRGRISSYLDGERWFSVDRVATQWPTSSTNPRYRQWSVNNYTDQNTPPISHIWIDDASIHA
jgi:hypothetical protein